MILRNVVAGLLVVAAISFAQSADTTLKSDASQQQVVAATASSKTENQPLKKQQKTMPTSTWSKIKDLFM